ncbi:MAG: riboflavin synthase [Lentisphaeria bacterium]|jgi:riboflavin synthase
MFTGLVEAVGKIVGRSALGKAGKLVVHAPDLPLREIKLGDSIAVNGVCLTVEAINLAEQDITFHTLAETLARTNLGRLDIGRPVNLEPALRLGDRLGGHIVTGHVDCTVPIRAICRPQDDWVVTVPLPAEHAALVVEKGSIALNGISLTVAAVATDHFTIHVIPHTWLATALHGAKPGDPANLEFDIVGKYILRQRQLAAPAAATAAGKAAVELETLAQAGFLD